MSEPRKLTDAEEKALRLSKAANQRYTREALKKDEDLTTPEHLLHDPLLRWMITEKLPATPQASLEKTAGIVARGLVSYVLDPENQAYMLGCVLAVPFTHKMRTLPGILFTMCGGLAMRQAYRAAKNLETLAEAARAKAGPDAADTPVET